MKKIILRFLSILFGLLLYLPILCFAQDDVFSSDVETIKKPWTHLDFYNNPMNFQFAIVSDNTGGSREGVFEEAISRLNLLKPEFVMCVGDLIQGYTQDTAQINFEWSEFNTSLSNLESPFFYLPGNHDITNLVMQKEWEKRYGRRYYHFIYKDVLFIIMDSNDDDDYSISEDQMNYILKSLSENQEVRWTYIFMHHPIWKYDTYNRFQTIESELLQRKYTVFAGHEHRYHHSHRNDHNYYVLATTGGGSSLLGHRFGRFDHITWLTVTEEGPVFANLELNNIHPHDVSNDETQILAKSLLSNSSFEHVLLTNSGDKFLNGTLYMSFNNSTDFDLKADIKFYHNHDVSIDKSKIKFNLKSKTDTIVAVTVKSDDYESYDDIDLLQFDWSFAYLTDKYSDFNLDGKYEISIEPVANRDYVSPSILQFTDNKTIKFSSPFKNLTVKYSTDAGFTDLNSSLYFNPIQIDESTKIQFALINEKMEHALAPPKYFEKIVLQKSVEVEQARDGLKFSYYEGKWESIPIFSEMEPIKSGIANDFLVSDLSEREDNFGIVYQGYIKAPSTDMYIFRMRADDASKLFIHDKLVVDDQTDLNYGAIFLEEGFHPIEIHYMEQRGSERLRMYYKNHEEEKWIFMPFQMFYN